MKFTIQTIMSIPVDGASCHLLIINETIKILLDCGIAHSFDFSKYERKIEELKNVCLVLVSHSQLEYSGALAFLVEEAGLDPKIFYTTQSIMRYSPLNVHENLLAIRSKLYTKKNFNKIYKIYESINIIKPQQKKCLDLSAEPEAPTSQQMIPESEEPESTIGQVEKQIFFTCYPAGGNMGSLAWRLSFGIVNILYLVCFNNYSLYHIDGVELAQIMQPTDILVTDTYRNIEDERMKKNYLYAKVKETIVKFYERNGISNVKAGLMVNGEPEKKLLISCYPNEMLPEIMAIMKKIIEEIQPPEAREKIRVIHLSSRFLQLIKSQMDYFSQSFKDTLENLEQTFMHSKTISGRINLTTLQALDGLLCDSIDKNVEVVHLGSKINPMELERIRLMGENNITGFKLLGIDEKLAHSSSKVDIEEEIKESEAEKGEESEFSEEKELTVSEVPDEVEIIAEAEEKSHQPLHGKYFSLIGLFPRFTSRQTSEEDQIFDEYGARHEYSRFQENLTIHNYKKETTEVALNEPETHKKDSTIEVMNIEFRIPFPPLDKQFATDFSKIQYVDFYAHKTNFNSSIQMIMTLKPDNVILINEASPKNQDSIGEKYKIAFRNQPQNTKRINLYELSSKSCHLELQNELISYKVNYIPIPLERKLQKVKGLITSSGKGLLYIHLDCLEEKEHLEFRLDKFYKQVKSLSGITCLFTKKGILINGVRIYREEKFIVLEGEYSEEYFKVRRLLYDFLQME